MVEVPFNIYFGYWKITHSSTR